MRRTALAHAFDCRAIGTDDRATRRRQPVGCGKLVTPPGRTRAPRHRDDRGTGHERHLAPSLTLPVDVSRRAARGLALDEAGGGCSAPRRRGGHVARADRPESIGTTLSALPASRSVGEAAVSPRSRNHSNRSRHIVPASAARKSADVVIAQQIARSLPTRVTS
jgi:hypothetical protein